ASAPTQEEMPAVSAPVISAETAETAGASAPTQEEMPAVSAPVISAEVSAVADASAPAQEELPAASAPVISAETAEPVGASAPAQEELPAASAPVMIAEPVADASEEAEMGEIAAVLNIFDQGAALPPENIVAPFGASTGIMTAPDMASLASMSAAETSLEPSPAVQDTQLTADSDSASGLPRADNSQPSGQAPAQNTELEGDSGLLGAPIENDAAGDALLGAPASMAGGGEGDVLLGAPGLEAAELGSPNQLGTPADAGPEKTFADAEPTPDVPHSDVPHSEEKVAEPGVADIPPEPTGLASPKVIASLLETMPEEQRQPAQAWLDEMNAHIDNGFAWLDREGVGQAEKTFWYVGGRLAEYPQLAGCLMAGLLEGSVETARSFAAGGFKQEAIRLISRVCLLAREYLSNQYDRDAWAWWGDAERLAGAMMHGVGKPNEAVDYLYQARNIFSEMLKNNKNPEARIDVFRISASRAALLLEMGFVPDAMEEYRIAIDNGLQVLADGFHEEMAVASLHVARGRLAIETGQLEMASHDYAWALETYEQLFIDDVDCVMEMCTARAGLAEAYAYLGNMAKMKEHFKGLLACRAQLDSEGKYDQVVVLDDLLENLNELGRTLFG
ncbi:MAG: hypothetical protein Q4F00_03095, partial [bacterium]|nr:hypothetical protein [bacterium]